MVERRPAWHAIIAFGLAHTVGRRWSWHAIIAFGQHTRPNDVEHGIISPPLNSTHGRTALGVACHHRLRAAYTVERRQAWLAIIALGWKTRSNDVRRGMPSPPLDSTHSRTMSGMKCNHRVWITHTVERRREWHDITVFGQHTQSKDVGHDMPSPPLDNTHGRTMLAGHAITNFGQLTRSNDIGQ